MRKKILFFLFFIFFINTALAGIVTAPAGYSIYSPEKWNETYYEGYYGGGGTLVLEAPASVKGREVKVVVQVFVDKEPSSIRSLDQERRFIITGLGGDPDVENPDWINAIEINGVKGLEYTYTTYPDTQTSKTSSTLYWVKNIYIHYNDKRYYITASVPEDDFDKYLDTFKLIIYSFKISGAPLEYSGLYAYDYDVDLSIDENGNRVMKKKLTTSVIGESMWFEYNLVPLTLTNFRAWDSEGPLRVELKAYIKEGSDVELGEIKIYYSREVGQNEYYSFTYQAEYSATDSDWDSLEQISSNTFEYIYGYSDHSYFDRPPIDLPPGEYYFESRTIQRHRATIRLPSNSNVLGVSGNGVKRKGTDIGFTTFLFDSSRDYVSNIVRYSLPSLAPTPSITEPAPTPSKTPPKPRISLHAQKTDVTVGEPIITELSAINIQTEPVMKIQTIITPPSGMSVTSSEFVTSIAGQANAQFEVKPGDQRSIIVTLQPNQDGDFELTGTANFYFGDDKSTEQTRELFVPVKVRAKGETRGTEPQAEASKTPGFVVALAMLSILAVARLLSRGR